MMLALAGPALSWWCSASSLAWSWTWRPYLGVWLFVVALVAGYRWLLRRAGPGPGPEPGPEGGAAGPQGGGVGEGEGDGGRDLELTPASRAQLALQAAATTTGIGAGAEDGTAGRLKVASYLAGVLVLWVASDWPVGTLGSGYLLTVHTLQYVLYCLVAPPLLLWGIPRGVVLAAREGAPRIWRVMRWAAHPLLALLVFNAVMLGSHTPAVIDGLRTTQLGSFAVDMAWMVGGLVLWWPVLAPPEVSRLSHPLKMGYLFLSTVLPTVPSAFMVFSDFPIYALYELAPRVNHITAMDDQLVAGITMKVLGDVIMWGSMLVVAIRWTRHDAALDRLEKEPRDAVA